MEDILTRNLRRYDKNLYAKRNSNGTLCVWASHKRVKYYEYDKISLGIVESDPYLVMALTENWSVRGEAVPWGIEVVLNRIKAMDLSKNEDLFKDMDEVDEEKDASEKRDFSNTVESFLYDYRSQFKKTFNDVNTSLMKK